VSAKKPNTFQLGELVMVKTPVDEYSIHDEQPALIIKDTKSYDSFAHVMYKGSPTYVHVNRLKRIPDANL
jgi:hypothetical protein